MHKKFERLLYNMSQIKNEYLYSYISFLNKKEENPKCPLCFKSISILYCRLKMLFKYHLNK